MERNKGDDKDDDQEGESDPESEWLRYFLFQARVGAKELVNELISSQKMEDFISLYLGQPIFEEYKEKIQRRIITVSEFLDQKSETVPNKHTFPPILITYAKKEVFGMKTLEKLKDIYELDILAIEKRMKFSPTWKGMAKHQDFMELICQNVFSEVLCIYVSDPDVRTGLINKEMYSKMTPEERKAKTAPKTRLTEEQYARRSQKMVQTKLAKGSINVFSDEQKITFITMWNEGKPYEQIKPELEKMMGRDLKISDLYSLRVALQLNPSVITVKWNKEDEDEVWHIWKNTDKTMEQIALMMGRTPSSISHKIGRLKVAELEEPTIELFDQHKDTIATVVRQVVGWQALLGHLRESTGINWTKENLIEYAGAVGVDLEELVWESYDDTGLLDHIKTFASKRTTWEKITEELGKIYPDRIFSTATIRYYGLRKGVNVISDRLDLETDGQLVKKLYTKYGEDYDSIAGEIKKSLEFEVSRKMIRRFIKVHGLNNQSSDEPEM
jgi:hypothetical protein